MRKLQLNQDQKIILFHIIQILFLIEFIPLWVVIVGIFIYLQKLFKLQYGNFFLKLLTVMSMGSILIYYRTLFDPEAAISLLVLIGSLKIMEINDLRDRLIVLMISLLYIAALGIFNNTLFTFVLMFSFAFYTLLNWMNYQHKDKKKQLHARFIIKAILITLPFTLILFLFFPRLSANFLALGRGKDEARIGFSEDIKNTNISNLKTSSKVAFRAIVNKKVNYLDLYWRGTTHWRTDGFNWNRNYNLEYPQPYGKEIKADYVYDIKYEQNFRGLIFTLENSKGININNFTYTHATDTNIFRLSRYKKINSYRGYSSADRNTKLLKNHEQRYIQLPKELGSSIKNIASEIKKSATSINDYIKNIDLYFKSNNFKYTLSPGSMKNLDDFLINKKGFCTHYASTSAIILRLLGVKTRLVSGFQGGEFNKLSNYLIIRDNDAHTWVEYYNPTSGWNRYDPTANISPIRFRTGGEMYFSSVDETGKFNEKDYNGFLNSNNLKFRLFIDNINFKWALFIDSFDRDFQNNLAKLLKIKVNRFYFLIIGFVIGLLVLYYFVFRLFRYIKDIKTVNYQKLFRDLIGLLNKHSNRSISADITPEGLKSLDLPPELQNQINQFADEISQQLYAGKQQDFEILKSNLNKIKRSILRLEQ